MYERDLLDPTTLKSYSKPHPVPPFVYVLIAIIVAMFVLSMFPSGAALMVDKQAPQIQLRSLTGELKVMDLKNDKIKVLDFWASWCGPCFDQTPSLLRLERENKDVEVLSINTDAPGNGRRPKIENFMRRGGWDFDVLLDNGRVMQNYKVAAFPTIVVVATDGSITYASSGNHSYESLVKQVKEARSR